MAHAPRSFYPLANGGEGAILFCFVFLYLVFAGGRPMEHRPRRAEAGLGTDGVRAVHGAWRSSLESAPESRVTAEWRLLHDDEAACGVRPASICCRCKLGPVFS
jgi:hypothetical protein